MKLRDVDAVADQDELRAAIKSLLEGFLITKDAEAFAAYMERLLTENHE
jgi:hypothetical protein